MTESMSYRIYLTVVKMPDHSGSPVVLDET